VTPSTLRRRLADEGTSWRTILEQARLEVCLREIRDPERPLFEVAAQLRYSDAAHFTRAFHRWMGESPSSYRARLTSPGTLSTIA
jgi:AraC-like DNA-binding protein